MLQLEEDVLSYVKLRYHEGQRIFLKPGVVPHLSISPEENLSEGKYYLLCSTYYIAQANFMFRVIVL